MNEQPQSEEGALVEELRTAIVELEKVRQLREDAVSLLVTSAADLQRASARHAKAIAAFDSYIRARAKGRAA